MADDEYQSATRVKSLQRYGFGSFDMGVRSEVTERWRKVGETERRIRSREIQLQFIRAWRHMCYMAGERRHLTIWGRGGDELNTDGRGKESANTCAGLTVGPTEVHRKRKAVLQSLYKEITVSWMMLRKV